MDSPVKARHESWAMEVVQRGLLVGQDGYQLWLRHAPLTDEVRRQAYRQTFGQVTLIGQSPTLLAVERELRHALPSMLAQTVSITRGNQPEDEGGLLVASVRGFPALPGLAGDLSDLGDEGFALLRLQRKGRALFVVAAQTDVGALYGVYELLRRLAQGLPVEQVTGRSVPKVKLRMLNHWDNLDGTIERGYAGHSLWNWYALPDIVDPRYTDYARACASVGINGITLTNVNANALILSDDYLVKVKALADVFRPYGVRVYLTARFSAPMVLDGLDTADPEDERVQRWWDNKCATIYRLIPDFGGFVVKANSEGQPGPQDYRRSHAQGANVLARALRPHGGHVMWRAFVYSAETPTDRASQAYAEFVPLDGLFEPNCLVQVKNGPIDFMPREPQHPLFGAMPRTPMMLEFQLTQEYLGNSTHLCYLGPLFAEVLHSPAHGGTVAQVVEGSLRPPGITGMTAVSNVGSDVNWCGHHFAAANWYAYGRLAWDPEGDPRELALEWIKQTWGTHEGVVDVLLSLMMESREAVVSYMTPLGLHHIMAYNHHQGPAPWFDQGRPDWTCTYYHRADAAGLGFDRTMSGSGNIEQYPASYQRLVENIATCPLELLLWFHHVPWSAPLSTGNTLWQELCLRYQAGVDTVGDFIEHWASIEQHVDELRYSAVRQALLRQQADAIRWKDACLSYFHTFSGLPYPSQVTPPQHTLDWYKQQEQYFVPGIPERRFGH